MGASADEAKLTLYDEAPATRCNPDAVGHGSTYLAYNDSSLFDWLLTHQRSSRAIESMTFCTEQTSGGPEFANSGSVSHSVHTSSAFSVQWLLNSFSCLML